MTPLLSTHRKLIAIARLHWTFLWKGLDDRNRLVELGFVRHDRVGEVSGILGMNKVRG